MDNIVNTTVYLTRIDDFTEVNAEYEKWFTAPFPARSCVAVSGLPKSATVEIEAIAVKEPVA